jgi:hypothetical protein
MLCLTQLLYGSCTPAVLQTQLSQLAPHIWRGRLQYKGLQGTRL